MNELSYSESNYNRCSSCARGADRKIGHTILWADDRVCHRFPSVVLLPLTLNTGFIGLFIFAPPASHPKHLIYQDCLPIPLFRRCGCWTLAEYRVTTPPSLELVCSVRQHFLFLLLLSAEQHPLARLIASRHPMESGGHNFNNIGSENLWRYIFMTYLRSCDRLFLALVDSHSGFHPSLPLLSFGH